MVEVRGVVLSGGEGKRLRPLSYYFQKGMIPIGGRQKPLLEYIVRLLKHHGVTDITLLVGYKHEQIVNYFNDGERFGVRMTYLLDDPELKGTGGSLLNAYRRGLIGSTDVLLVYYGDIISNVDLTEMLRQHREKGATATLALSRGYRIRVGVAEVKEGKVACLTEKPELDVYAGIGILVLNAVALPELENLSRRYSELDVMGHLIPCLIEKGELVHAYVTDAFWYDVGSTERYEKLDNYIVEKCLGNLLV